MGTFSLVVSLEDYDVESTIFYYVRYSSLWNKANPRHSPSVLLTAKGDYFMMRKF